MTNINPLKAFGDDLLEVQNPARYLGGEYGQIVKKGDDYLNFTIAFPDLYEIGMSNQAIKIIYNGLNARQNIRCERVFTPDTDFEQLLKEKNVPLYTLETGIPLHETDIIGFSIGYELGITGLLSILDYGKVPLLKKDRTENDPIVIAGGCGVTNPAPFSIFLDAVFIGEAENQFFDLIDELAKLKKAGGKRADLLKKLTEHPSVWIPGKKAIKATQADFGKVPSVKSYFPVANIKPVQDHGVVEIMRGCPNGCRFCHAGIYYRPQRVKDAKIILEEVDEVIYKGGQREVSLSSLSSGDYTEIDKLLEILSKKYQDARVSFQLPSLKVNSFTLPLLEKLSEVRKSGLTFAVETPSDAWQLSLNKEVFKEKLIEIIKEAKKRGWNKAKFYFMIGLPPGNDSEHLAKNPDNKKTEEQEIVDFLIDIQEATKINCSVNVGTFIPKAHTPYERVRQLTIEEATEKMLFIRKNLPRGKFKVSTHYEFVSFIEGMISRGDERVGHLLLKAYQKGCRLDAWEDHMEIDIWKSVISEADFDVVQEITRERAKDEELPWKDISLGPKDIFYKKEFENSVNRVLTNKCATKCISPCGVCNVQKNIQVNTNSNLNLDKLSEDVLKSRHKTIPSGEQNIPVLYRVLFSFTKQNGGEYIPHLATQDVIHKAFLRSELPVVFTDGFNPVPRLELATTLSLGIDSVDEIASCLLRYETSEEEFVSKINESLPQGLKVNSAYIFPVSNKRKRESLSSALYGAVYQYKFLVSEEKLNHFVNSEQLQDFMTNNPEFKFSKTDNPLVYDVYMPFRADRPFRNLLEEVFEAKLHKILHISKLKTLAKEGDQVGSFYDIFKIYADIHSKLIFS